MERELGGRAILIMARGVQIMTVPPSSMYASLWATAEETPRRFQARAMKGREMESKVL